MNHSREGKLNQSIVHSILPHFPGVELLYLFGSILTHEDFQDIDFAVFLKDDLTPYQQIHIALSLGTRIEEALAFKWPIDVRVLNGAPPYFQFEVISTGVLIYAVDEETRVEREYRILHEYLDMKYLYDLFDELTLKEDSHAFA
jgi:predicted nucleotidyltransferase